MFNFSGCNVCCVYHVNEMIDKVRFVRILEDI